MDRRRHALRALVVVALLGASVAAHAAPPPGSVTVFYRYLMSSVEAPRSARGWPPVETTILTTYKGSKAESFQQRLDASSAEAILESYLEYYASETVRIEATAPLQVLDNLEDQELTLVERYRLTPLGPWRFETLPLLLGFELPYPELGDSPPAGGPALTLPPVDLEETVEVVAAGIEGWGPVDAEIETPWFRFDASSEVDAYPEGPGIRIVYRLETRTDAVPFEDLPRYAEALDQVYEHLGYGIPPDVESDASSNERAIAALFAVFGVCLAVLVLGAALVLGLLLAGGFASSQTVEPGAARFDALPLAMTPIDDYQSPRGLRLPLTLALGALAAVTLVRLGASTVTLVMTGFSGAEDPRWVDLAGAVSSVHFVALVLVIVSAILFLAWQLRIQRNLPALGTPEREHGTLLALGGWFVPIANLFVPPYALHRAAAASRPLGGRRLGLLIVSWWIAWQAANVLVGIDLGLGLGVGLGRVPGLQADEWWRSTVFSHSLAALAMASTFIALVLALLFVVRLTEQQDLRHEQLLRAAENDD